MPEPPPKTVEDNPLATERERLELEAELKAERDILREYYGLALLIPAAIDAYYQSIVNQIPEECGGWNESDN